MCHSQSIIFAPYTSLQLSLFTSAFILIIHSVFPPTCLQLSPVVTLAFIINGAPLHFLLLLVRVSTSTTLSESSIHLPPPTPSSMAPSPPPPPPMVAPTTTPPPPQQRRRCFDLPNHPQHRRQHPNPHKLPSRNPHLRRRRDRGGRRLWRCKEAETKEVI